MPSWKSGAEYDRRGECAGSRFPTWYCGLLPPIELADELEVELPASGREGEEV